MSTSLRFRLVLSPPPRYEETVADAISLSITVRNARFRHTIREKARSASVFRKRNRHRELRRRFTRSVSIFRVRSQTRIRVAQKSAVPEAPALRLSVERTATEKLLDFPCSSIAFRSVETRLSFEYRIYISIIPRWRTWRIHPPNILSRYLS